MPLGLGGNISNIGNSFALPGVPQTNVLPMRNYCTSVKRMMPLIPTAAPFDIEGIKTKLIIFFYFFLFLLVIRT